MNKTLAVFVTGFALIATVAAEAAPQGWLLRGSRPQDYTAGADSQNPKSGSSSALLQSLPDLTPDGFGTLMQAFDAVQYRGKRLRLIAEVRAEDVKQWAGLWMRVDAEPSQTLAFDNMEHRPITGTKGWRRYEVVLNVPPQSKTISFGVLLSGPGKVWIDDVRFEEVDRSVPTTGFDFPGQEQAPLNLDFESR
jgi:hypothetical protein